LPENSPPDFQYFLSIPWEGEKIKQRIKIKPETMAIEAAMEASYCVANRYPPRADNTPKIEAKMSMVFNFPVNRKAEEGGTTNKASTKMAPTDSKEKTVVSETADISP
jgi:hypothetical protein